MPSIFAQLDTTICTKMFMLALQVESDEVNACDYSTYLSPTVVEIDHICL